MVPMAFQTIFTKVRKKKGKITESRAQEMGDKGKGGRAKTGLEVEFFIVDKEGRICNEADRILSHIKTRGLGYEVVKECTYSFIELGVYPLIYVRNVASKFLDDLSGVLEVVEDMNLGLFPLAIYPGEYEPRMRKGGWYGVKGRIFGSERWTLAGRCTGFHFHYSLPRGIFSYGGGSLVEHATRREKQKALNSYNFAIAADTALTAFTQSSPIMNGRFLAKDSRMLLYRGGKELRYDGLYTRFPQFGRLPQYKVTYEELIVEVEERYNEWVEHMKKAGAPEKLLEKYNKLDFGWNPVRINKVGTVEMRGMDMNLPSTLMAVGIMAKYVLKNIQREDLEIVPTVSAIQEPFKFEDDQIYVPPFWYVNSYLQYQSALRGMDNDAIYKYCKNFFSLCMRFTNKKYYPALKPIKDMLKTRQTRSDEILRRLRKLGYRGDEPIPDEVLRGVVLYYSNKLKGDTTITEELMESLTEGGRSWL
jgi:carboxylate-amine ligase